MSKCRRVHPSSNYPISHPILDPISRWVPLKYKFLNPKKQRIGRGGKRGGSSGRGNGGQKHHGKKPVPWFTGLAADPLTDTIPAFPWSPRALKPQLKVLNLDRLQHWLDMGRLPRDQVITMRHLVESKCIIGRVVDGVKLLGNGAEYFKTPNVCIEVTRVSQTAIARIEEMQGKVTAVYHTRAGIQQLIYPTISKPMLFERPILEKDIEYYADYHNRGYLASRDVYESEFKPRGYCADRDTELELSQELFLSEINLQLEKPQLAPVVEESK